MLTDQETTPNKYIPPVQDGCFLRLSVPMGHREALGSQLPTDVANKLGAIALTGLRRKEAVIVQAIGKLPYDAKDQKKALNDDLRAVKLQIEGIQ